MSDVPNRRRSNDPLLEKLLEGQRLHMDRYHANLEPGEAEALVSEHRTLVKDMAEGNQKLDLIVDMLAGKPSVDKLTGEVKRAPGIDHRVEILEEKSNGGGGLTAKMTWTSTLRVAVLTSLMTGGAVVLAAIINRI